MGVGHHTPTLYWGPAGLMESHACFGGHSTNLKLDLPLSESDGGGLLLKICWSHLLKVCC